MEKVADLYRMVTDKHMCPYGIKAKSLLKTEGYKINDHHLKNRDEIEAFKEAHDVKTTPQIFIDNKRIGGFDDLVKHFGKITLKQEGITYQPIIAIFCTTFMMAVAFTYAITSNLHLLMIVEQFIAISMCVLGIMKLRDLFSFSNQFLAYDLLAQKWVPYAYIYPFVETGAGILMVSGVLTWLSAPSALLIGLIGAISVFKAVWLDKRDIKCACVGGNSSVPLGFISLTENIMMIAMAVWMLIKSFGVS